MKRVYVPTTPAMWQRLVAYGSMFPVSGTAFAVTPALRESYVEQHNAQTTYSSKAYSVPDRDKKENFGLAATSEGVEAVRVLPRQPDYYAALPASRPSVRYGRRCAAGTPPGLPK